MFIEFLVTLVALSMPQSSESPEPALEAEAIQSQLIKTDSNDLILLQEVVVEAPVEEVWNAYTTEEGWRSWASPVVEIDLRAGGTIRTHYGADAKIGDPGTNTLHILNYVPLRLLTLQAEVEDRWPEVMKQDAGNLMNVIIFESPTPAQTRILSYGVGYRDSEAYTELMNFFIPANEGLFKVLKSSLED